MAEGDPGVPEAVGRALDELSFRIPPTEIDRVWIFPPLRRGRKETGVLAAGCYAPEGRHLLVTVAYRAEETGRGVEFEATVHEEGEAPPDRLPRIMTGVVRRLRDEDPGDPQSEELAGDPERFLALAETLVVPAPALDPVRNSQEKSPS